MTQVGEREFTKLLSPATGYGVVVGLGAAFAVLMIAFTYLQRRFTRFDTNNAAEFATASRSIKPGLICAGIVSAWTWSATLLQSSTATYQSGLSAAWWYGVGGTIQIAFFAAIAAKVKMNANGATTFLQICRARYGTASHLLFTFYALVCAHIVSGSLILGASATINALTGANIEACNFLLPIGIAIYVIAGGLRATFICDFTHTVILFVIIYMFMFSAYATSPQLGSISKLYDLLVLAGQTDAVAGNTEGSYLTMKSNAGILFAGCTIASGFSGVFCDQGYWQRAIASRPESTTKAYMLGGLSWFAIPWAFGTTMGLSARALQTSPNFPTYPFALSASQQSAGLVAPAAAVTLLGTGGAAAILLATFMAATSAASSELIAVSSIVVYDIFGTYGRPLTGKQVVFWSHLVIAIAAVWFGAWACILHAANIDLGWLFYIQGVCLTPAVVPIGLTVVWGRMSKVSAFWGTLFGTVCGMLGWFLGCWKVYGVINTANLAKPYAAISGSAPGLVMSTLATLILAYFFPGTNDWTATRAIHQADDNASTNAKGPAETAHVETGDAITPSPIQAPIGNEKNPAQSGELAEKRDVTTVTTIGVANRSPFESDDDEYGSDNGTKKELDQEMLQKVFKRASIISGTVSLIITIIVPIPMFAAHYVFSVKFFKFWISAAFIWAFLAGIFCIVLPVWESRRQLMLIGKAFMGAGRAMRK
ncbi:hypothetical protein CI109_106262 [Kwoniella shandongensis]|uniref:Uncharacterized protein n=1 Tax=Kwoniella shandongensis TaxID=1734106 RepID=A0A5M6BYW0_9TREE|nr:uncharacterized protein CI109_003865 [Kwoniella shandongensis]KAA5527893.1 hypothetical protein CI109_003865 [Kwoniella shandongensis]